MEFVGAKCEALDAEGRDVEGVFPDILGGVDMEEMSLARFDDGWEVLDDTNLVVGKDDADERQVFRVFIDFFL